MSRITDIIVRARDTLADASADRWSEERLLRLVSEGQEDLAKQTRLLKGQVDLDMVSGQHTYPLPTDMWMITRAAFESCSIELMTHHELDELVRTRTVNQTELYYTRRGTNTKDFSFANFCWELEEANEVEAIIYDRRNMDEVRVFPIPLGDADSMVVTSIVSGSETYPYTLEELLGVTVSIDIDCDVVEATDLFGVLSDVTIAQVIEEDTVFGIVTDYSDGFILSSLYGVITDVLEGTDQYVIEPIYGVTTAMFVSIGKVHLWYIKLPPKLATVDDALSLPRMWDVALKYYVIAHAFDDDYDTKNEAKSAKALALYERELGVAKKTDAMDGVRASQYRTDYRGAFE